MKKIPLFGKYGEGKFTIVDDDDYETLKKYKWLSSPNDYVYTSIKHGVNNFEAVRMHRMITNTPKGLVVDHINHNPLDNRKENLRVCTQQENLMNCRTYKNTSSKYKGVYFQKHAKNKQWRSSIAFKGERIHIGYYETEEQAARAYNEVAKKLFGEYVYLNQLETD